MVLSEYELKKYNKNTLKNSVESKSVFCFDLTDLELFGKFSIVH